MEFIISQYNRFINFVDKLTFDNFIFLFFLPIPIILAAWIINHRGHRIVLPLDNVHAKSRRILRSLITTCSLSVVVLGAISIFILASPVEQGIPHQERKLTNIDIVFDLSHSMLDPAGNGYPETFKRHNLAVQETINFCKLRKGDAVGLTFFANYPINWLPPTKEFTAIQDALRQISPKSLPRNDRGTFIGAALRASADKLSKFSIKSSDDDSDDEDEDSQQKNATEKIMNQLNKGSKDMVSEGDKMILLITDGESMDMKNKAHLAQEVADELLKKKIVVYAILISPKNDSVTQELEIITSTTGGEARLSKDPKKLREIFKEINSMKKAVYKRSDTAQQDNYAPFAWVGIIALCFYALGAIFLRYTPW